MNLDENNEDEGDGLEDNKDNANKIEKKKKKNENENNNEADYNADD